ncbi:hypothetical protein KOI35_15640 [Actinoplanes bogorensis]|uniref:Uncharacterized protein n=1 Tax=Paractinoplanes bogorensis TaxID=1610840 RepID=A0ABS5YSC6_9ACTN|nr:hypothetical protein [Actinoplanes bogorensis]MBU2664935.1 hypothetical protein [Actinoplanes bogorensis]
MNQPDPLRAAAGQAPRGAALSDALEYLDHNEFEIALDALAELGEARSFVL